MAAEVMVGSVREPLIIVFPVIILILAYFFRQLELSVTGSSYWRERTTNYWLLLVAWAIFYFLFSYDCYLAPVPSLGAEVCTQFNFGLFAVFTVIALYAAFQWYKLSRKRIEFLQKMRV